MFTVCSVHQCSPCADEDRQTAERIKLQANDLFKRGKFKAAIDLYTEAITFAPSMHVLFVNRALCHRKLEEWPSCERDSRSALDLHSGLMKARSARQLCNSCEPTTHQPHA